MYTDYTVATYNIGQDFDYKQLLIRNGHHSKDLTIQTLYQSIMPGYLNALQKYNLDTSPNKPFWMHPNFVVTDEEQNIFKPTRQERLIDVFNMMKKNCDIILLQEVMSKSDYDLIDRIFKDTFSKSCNYELNYNQVPETDAICIWNNSKFSLIKDDLSCSKKVSNVLLADNITDFVIHATSLHAPGFEIMHPTDKNVSSGDQVVSTLAENFQIYETEYKPLFSLIGGDFNSLFKPTCYTTENELKLSQNRFKILEDKGFIHVAQDKPTAYNKGIAAIKNGNGGCDLDHFYIKNGAAKEVSHTEVAILSDCFPLEDPSINGSDHRPLFFEFTLKI